ncbi:xanthine dehydrogenase family protein molybdopterin-binding subunit [Agrobacterium tumefaciens]|uniref:Carbon-monoxide dehydrogenase large subunit n=1 Tax=Agrobacterium tumefaciens TaxID=358 RepID=A0A2L2LM54_AGRTU|nr:xanthine dehydrogenase family protein molybdopterin-binding subunit [Agrobacterium tumefaciens]AVH45414.1 carbon-monoxide dehydrogenase large subunit [Agrobacterium tumefaciens]NSY99143.1 xanthine dehydrogenase family protein molybdopterin-binding subunit [Agrobacterium tumefaciens]
MSKFGIGQNVKRVEDVRFITGRGRYVDDIHLSRECIGHVVLSPMAHAKILSIDVSEALKVKGVIAVLTGQDVEADGLGPMIPNFMPQDFGLSKEGYRTQRPILVADRVRYVGDRVAFVVAETLEAAQEAAEVMEIEYEPLAAVPNKMSSLETGAPAVWDACQDNVCFTIEMGNEAKTEAVFNQAVHRVAVSLKNNRVAANPLEPRAAIGCYDASDDSYTLYTTSQSPHAVREQLAENVFHISQGRLRVISPDVGGGFGVKSDSYPEDALVLWASKRCGRPVRWLLTRSDMLVGDFHARDEVVEGELALDGNGKILGMRAHSVHWLGAYVAPTGAIAPWFTIRYSPGVYDIQNLWITAKGAFSNTAPTHVYRGPGRAEGNFLIERLMDEAAAVIGIRQDEIRRINAISSDAMPYVTPTGSTYDSGEFLTLMARCQKLADWTGYEERRAASQKRGMLRGRSVIFYIEHAGIFNDRMELRFDPSGSVTIVSGLHSHGQGHATTFAQMVSEWLGVPFDSIRFLQGDTDKVAFGRGTYSARSSLLASVALKSASGKIVEKARVRAAEFLEVEPEDVDFEDGVFKTRGSNKSLLISDVAKSLFQPVHLDEKHGLGLEAIGVASSDIPNYPNGCHICEVDIDPETGRILIDRYSVVDDVGHAINPMICEGQIVGGIAQGLGQAMLEEIVYDEEGQILTGSFMDYAMPRASDMSHIMAELAEFPCKSNPLGVKGVGESGTIGAPPAIANAVIDALRGVGVTNIDMPFTPHKVWHAIRAAKAS